MLPAPAPVVVVHQDMGGEVSSFSARVSLYLKRNVTVRIEGECASACTMVTAVPSDRICVAPGAKLEFHQAYHPNPRKPFDAADRSEKARPSSCATTPKAFATGSHGMVG